ncbi:MAG: (d)CMP kinase [Chitinophagales bacterium]
MNKKIIIAIDGHASCGKSTLAKTIAKNLEYIYLDSGAMYRAVTLYVIENGVDILDKKSLLNALQNINVSFQYNAKTQQSDTYLNEKNVEQEIRSKKVAQRVSEVATMAEIRRFLVKQQRQIGENRGLVCDGRDIGTVVFPDAELKIFLTANLITRTQRRYDELQGKGIVMTAAEISDNLQQRDFIDSTRAVSPLRKAEDAIVLDNSNLNRAEQLQTVLEWVNALLFDEKAIC